MLEGILNFLITMLALRIIFNLIVKIKSRRELRKHMNKYNSTANNKRKEQFAKSTRPREFIEIVEGEYCGTKVPREDSYIAVIDDERHYFCSWECRQKYLEEMRQKEENIEEACEETCPN